MARADRPRQGARSGGDEPDVLVRLDGVRKGYRHVVAVERVHLEVRRGEFFTLLGPSGSGKTTTLRLIAGFERPDSGVIEIGGHDVSRIPPYDRNVNTVFQDYALFPHMSVAENVAYGLRAKRVARDERQRRVVEVLRMVQLAELAGRLPRQLSGGQQQRVALARAIVNRPAVLLLDEPLGALDLKLRQEMQIELKHIQEQVGITFLYVTHDQEEALTMSDRLAVFNLGRIEQVGTPGEVYAHPASEFVAGFVGTSSIIRRAGRRLVVRPEKVRIAPLGQELCDPGLHVETGRLLECVYVGMFTRYVVELEDHVRVLGVQQNLGGPGVQVIEQQGRCVQVAWKPDELHALPEAGPSQEEEGT